MKLLVLSALAATMSLAVGTVQAQQAMQTSRVDRAEVISVQPYHDASRADGTHTREREECWNERTRGYESGYYRDSDGRLYRGDSNTNTSGMLIGALVGGALGNQVGKGDGRKAATVAGAVIGGVVGAHTGNDDHQYRGNDGVVRRCRTVVTTVNNGRSDRDFLVTYRYAGKTYTSRTEHKPGRWLDVSVEVLPRDPAVNRR